MATNTKGGVSLKEFLEAQGLEKYEDTFELQGARNVDDLVDFDLNMLTEDICMTKLEAERFLRKLTEMFGGKPLLIDAEPDDPLDSVKATELRCHRDMYLQKAFDHADINAHARTKRDIRIDLLRSG